MTPGAPKIKEIIDHNLKMANLFVSLISESRYIDKSQIYQKYFTVRLPLQYVSE